MLEIIALQKVDYATSHQRQKTLVNELKMASLEGIDAQDYLYLCEHPHSYTFGKSADRNHLLVNDAFLEQIDAQRFDIERGGDITYHGPGQLVGYPILDLKRLGIGVKQYVYQLEETIIQTVKSFGIDCYRIDGQIGLWVNQKQGPPNKIAAIGIKVSQGVTMHGFALNVNTDLSYFNHIVPCGIADKGVTSISTELGESVDLDEVSKIYSDVFLDLF